MDWENLVWLAQFAPAINAIVGVMCEYASYRIALLRARTPS